MSQSSQYAFQFFLTCYGFLSLQLLSQPPPVKDLEVAILPTQKKSNREIAWCPSATSCGFVHRHCQNLINIGKLLPQSQTHFLDSGKWTENVTLLNEVVDWLGYSKECHFEEVLQFNTGGKGGYYHDKKNLTRMDPNCRYIGSSLSSSWW